jgi:N-acetylglutamate synthase-like GNAT family acetyltransferase
MTPEIRIVPYTDDWKQPVIDLVISIQRGEFGIAITAQEQPDLMDIPGFCQKGCGNFWVALDGDEVVGTIALLDLGGGLGALRKMFVEKTHRGRETGLALRLLETLLAWAREKGLTEILLGTTAAYHAAHRFYEKHGFSEVAPGSLPERFPRIRQDSRFYRMIL